MTDSCSAYRLRKSSRCACYGPPDAGYILLGAILVLALTFLSVGTAVTVYSRDITAEFNDDTQEELDELNEAIHAYYEDVGAFPAQLADLATKPGGVTGWMGPYVKKTFKDWEASGLTCLRDSWGSDYIYTAPVSGLVGEIRSPGADAEDDSGDDDDLTAQFDVNHVEWKKTREEIRILRNAVSAYNYQPTNPDTLPSNWSTAVSHLQSNGMIPSGTAIKNKYLKDGWKQDYVPQGAPKIKSVKSNGSPDDDD